MPTKITNATIGDGISGSAEKRLDTAPDGTLWSCVVDPNTIRFFFSTNGGSTWKYATGSDVKLGQYSGAPSFFIDADGYAHMSMQRFNTDPQVLVYWRGKPKTGGGWDWSSIVVNPASGRMGVDTDVVAFRQGSGWVAFALYNVPAGHRIARINISSSGALSVGATSMPGLTDGYLNSYASLTFDHTGNGKTPTATPHLYLVTGAMTSQTLRNRRLRYESGNWTAEAWVNIATAQSISQTAMVSVFDGTRVMTLWSPNDSTVDMSEWVPSGSTVTRRDPGAIPTAPGTIGGISVAVDRATGDLHVVAYGYGTQNVWYAKFQRSNTTWGSWTQIVTRSSNSAGDGNVQLVRHPPKQSVDLVYMEGPNGNYVISYQQVVALTVTPNPPTLLRPTAGQQLDLSNGGQFTWDYNEVGPGDTQSAWSFRRTQGSTVQYWNNSAQTWGSSLYWNTGTAQLVAFPAGAWPTGTYSWSIAAKNSNAVASDFAGNRTIISTLTPVVVVTAPVGIIYDTNTPVITWTYTFTDAQRNFEVRVQRVNADTDPNNAAQNVWTSGVVTSTIARSVTVAVPLLPNVAYRAFVRATSTSSLTSEWDYTEFLLSLAPPIGPYIGATNYVDFTTGVPRALLRLMARSNEMSLTQSQCISDWEASAGASLAYVQRDTIAQVEAGFSLTSASASGNTQGRVSIGTPPDAPYGQPLLTGPVNFPVLEGEQYTFLIMVKAAATVRAARVFIRWLVTEDGSPNLGNDTVQQTVLATVGTGANIPDSYGDQVVISTTAYTMVSVTATAPPGAKLGKPYVEVLNTSNGEVDYFTNASFHPGNSLVWQPGGYSQTQTIRVERSDDGEKTWETIIDRVKPGFRQNVRASDRSMPFGVEVVYRAYTDVDTGIGQTLSSSVSRVAYTTITADVWAFRDMTQDQAEVNALVTAHEYTDEEAASVSRPSGRTFAIVDTEGNQSPEGSLTVYVPMADKDSMVSILRSGATVLVQSPIGTLFNARFLKRNYNVEDIAAREISIDYVEVS